LSYHVISMLQLRAANLKNIHHVGGVRKKTQSAGGKEERVERGENHHCSKDPARNLPSARALGERGGWKKDDKAIRQSEDEKRKPIGELLSWVSAAFAGRGGEGQDRKSKSAPFRNFSCQGEQILPGPGCVCRKSPKNGRILKSPSSGEEKAEERGEKKGNRRPCKA